MDPMDLTTFAGILVALDRIEEKALAVHTRLMQAFALNDLLGQVECAEMLVELHAQRSKVWRLVPLAEPLKDGSVPPIRELLYRAVGFSDCRDEDAVVTYTFVANSARDRLARTN